MSAIEQALEGLVRLATNARRPRPDPNTLGGYLPALQGLSRDGGGIIMQTQGDPMRPLDGGDSANRTGVLAFCGSNRDAELLPLFFNVGTSLATRHPTQAPWNNPNNFSRDQLIAYLAGCWRSGRTDIASALLRAHEARGFTCQNFENDFPGTVKSPPIGDPLGPQDMMYLRVCAGDSDAIADLVSMLTMYTSIQFLSSDAKIEINQSLLEAMVCCQLDVFVNAHSNFDEQLNYYWGHERGQQSIADAWIHVVNLELERYESPDLWDFLLPPNLLAELRHIDLNEALNALRTFNPAYFAELAGKLTIAILRDLKYAVDLFVNGARALLQAGEEVAAMALRALQSEVTKNLAKLDQFLKDLGPLHTVSVVLKTAAGLLGLDSSDDSDRQAELQFRADVLRGLQTIQRDTTAILANVAKLQVDMERHFAELGLRVDAGFYDLIVGGVTSRSQAILSVMDSLNATPKPTDAERERLKAQLNGGIVDLATSMAQCTRYGAPALPAAFHAYSILVTAASLLSNTVQVKTFKIDYRDDFMTMLDGDKGLAKTIRSLEQLVADGYNAFDRVRNRILIGAVNVRRGDQRNMASTKDIIPADGYWRTKVYATLQGSIEAGEYVVSFVPDDAGEAPVEFAAVEGGAEPRVWSAAQVIAAPWYGGLDLDKYHSPDVRERQINARDEGVRAIIGDAGERLKALLKETRERVLYAKEVLPGHRSLYAAVKATFGEPASARRAVDTGAAAPVPQRFEA